MRTPTANLDPSTRPPTTAAPPGPVGDRRRPRSRRRTLVWSGVAAAVVLACLTAGVGGPDGALVDASGSPSTSIDERPGAPVGEAATSSTTAGGASDVATEAGAPGSDGAGRAADTVPSDEDDEAARPGTPGLITGSGMPGAIVAAPLAPPVELAIVEPFAPASPPAPVADTSPIELLEAPAHGPIGDLTSNAVGCASSCLTTAVVTRAAFTTTLQLEVETNVAARLSLYLSTDEPTIVGGVPVFPGVAPQGTSGVHVTSWSRTIAGLDADTTYHLILRATDQHGHSQYVTAPVHTTDQADQLVSPGDGCTFQCITAGVAVPTDRFDVVDLHVATSTPAELSVAVSTQEPGWIGSSPILPADVPVSVPSGLRQDWALSVTGLAPETTYHVVVRATDGEGRHSSRIGQFTTAPEPPATVQVTIEHVTIGYDGDAGDRNRGEVELLWSVGEQVSGYRTEEKMGDGTVVPITSYGTATFSVDRDSFVPGVVVNARERDNDGHSNEGADCAVGFGVSTQTGYNAPCDSRTNVALTGLQTFANVEALPSCATFGLIGAKEHDRCAALISPDLGDEYVRFWALVSYHIS